MNKEAVKELIDRLEKRTQEALTIIDRLTKENNQLIEQNKKLIKENKEFKEQIENLKKELEIYKLGNAIITTEEGENIEVKRREAKQKIKKLIDKIDTTLKLIGQL